MEYDGKSLQIKCQDEVSGALTCNMGILRYNEQDGLFATLDIRYPILCDHKALSGSLTAALAPNVTATVASQKDPHHVAPNSRLVTALMSAYAQVTGDTQSRPMAIGGGTYAKMIPNTLAFGPIFPGDEVREHKPDEYMEVSRLMDNAAILAAQMLALSDEALVNKLTAFKAQMADEVSQKDQNMQMEEF